MLYTFMNFNPVNLQHLSCKHVFSMRVENCMDPDQMASSADLDLHFFFLKKGYKSWFSMTRGNTVDSGSGYTLFS